MTQELDINTLASWATVAVAAAAGVGFIRKGQKWFDKTDERLKGLETGQTALNEGQAKLEDGQTALNEGQVKLEDGQAAVEGRLNRVEAQLRPNGGSSHHDVLRREIREALEEASDGGRRRRRR